MSDCECPFCGGDGEWVETECGSAGDCASDGRRSCSGCRYSGPKYVEGPCTLCAEGCDWCGEQNCQKTEVDDDGEPVWVCEECAKTQEPADAE